MSNKSRLGASLVYLMSMVMTLVSALALKKPLLVLVFSLLQVCAYVWYTASYVPFGRAMLKACLCKCFSK